MISSGLLSTKLSITELTETEKNILEVLDGKAPTLEKLAEKGVME